MKIETYDFMGEIKDGDFWKVFFDVYKNLKEIYDNSLVEPYELKAVLSVLNKEGKLGDKILEGKTILELGCGGLFIKNNNLLRFKNEKDYYVPWLLRGLESLGAECIGVDSKLNGEDFTCYKKDPRDEDCLSGLDDGSVDLACGFRLFDNSSFKGYRFKKEDFERLVSQLERVLKSDGCFLVDKRFGSYFGVDSKKK